MWQVLRERERRLFIYPWLSICVAESTCWVNTGEIEIKRKMLMLRGLSLMDWTRKQLRIMPCENNHNGTWVTCCGSWEAGSWLGIKGAPGPNPSGGRVGLPTPENNFQTPTGCLRIQPKSDTVYPDIISDPTGMGSVPQACFIHTCALTYWLQAGGFSDPLLGLQMPGSNLSCHCVSEWPAINQRFSWPHPYLVLTSC